MNTWLSGATRMLGSNGPDGSKMANQRPHLNHALYHLASVWSGKALYRNGPPPNSKRLARQARAREHAEQSLSVHKLSEKAL